MGRHGGGSRSGGSRGSSGGRGGRSGGSGTRTSFHPFSGCYNRSYYHRGRLRNYYTSDKQCGTESGWNFSNIFMLIMISIIMLPAIIDWSFSGLLVSLGSKINGNREFIGIEDTVDMLTDEEEARIISLFEQVYKKSGMPIFLYTDDFDYKEQYNNIEAYSEDLYYTRTQDESSMIILYTYDKFRADRGVWYDWDYDFYCGDDTYTCLSDQEFNDVLYTFYKTIRQGNLVESLELAWNGVMDNLAETEVDTGWLFIIMFVLAITYLPLLLKIRKQNIIYKYFKEHPEELSMRPYDTSAPNDVISKLLETLSKRDEPKDTRNICLQCGAENAPDATDCRYCGSKL